MKKLTGYGKELTGRYTKEIIGSKKVTVKAPPPIQQTIKRFTKKA